MHDPNYNSQYERHGPPSAPYIDSRARSGSGSAPPAHSMMDPGMMPGHPMAQGHSKKPDSSAFPGMNGHGYGGPPGQSQFDMPPMGGAGPGHRPGKVGGGAGGYPHFMGMVGDDVDPNAMPSFH